MGYTSMGQIEQELYGDLENDAELEAELLALQGEDGGGSGQTRAPAKKRHSEWNDAATKNMSQLLNLRLTHV